VDVGGNPTKGRFGDFVECLDKAREEGMKVTVHCGEVDNVEEVREIVRWRPDRLGHFLKVPEEIWGEMEEVRLSEERSDENHTRSYFRTRRAFSVITSIFLTPYPNPFRDLLRSSQEIPIEICPTSNIMTLNLPNLSSHPTLRRLVEGGYPVSINTDDCGVFSTTQSQELYMVAREMGLNEYTISGIVWGAVDLVFEGNRRVRARLARDVMKGIKGRLERLEMEDKA